LWKTAATGQANAPSYRIGMIIFIELLNLTVNWHCIVYSSGSPEEMAKLEDTVPEGIQWSQEKIAKRFRCGP